ncbi:MAG: 1-acyl-sn-glycerol-3-phosphate acyltransferase [Chloroflexi bacterium]|nr:1-acyl-sn-glycerol-3-phosphate acyltransferase [Chloroflexota bacterium]
MKRKTLQRIVVFLVNHLTRTEFIDIENLPPSGGVIVAINHMSHIDTPVLFANPRRPDITALVTTKYQAKSFIRWFTSTAEGIWINRDIADFTAIRKAAEALDKGLALGISPEGTRSQDARLQEGKPGTVMLALKSGMPIVPVGITGTEDALKVLSRLRRPRITVRFGEPFTLPEFHPHHRSEELQKWTEILMQRIAALLPESYRGVYA